MMSVPVYIHDVRDIKQRTRSHNYSKILLLSESESVIYSSLVFSMCTKESVEILQTGLMPGLKSGSPIYGNTVRL